MNPKTQTAQDYLDKETEILHFEMGAFYAFSKEQFEAKKQDGVIYKQTAYGLLIPKENYEIFRQRMNAISVEYGKRDIEQNGLENVICRELNNHEAYFTGDIDETVDALADHGITREQVENVLYH